MSHFLRLKLTNLQKLRYNESNTHVNKKTFWANHRSILKAMPPHRGSQNHTFYLLYHGKWYLHDYSFQIFGGVVLTRQNFKNNKKKLDFGG